MPIWGVGYEDIQYIGGLMAEDLCSQKEAIDTGQDQAIGEQLEDPKQSTNAEGGAITKANNNGRTSVRKIVANRQNGKKSTGPRTVAGKQRSSRNAITHGLLARHAVISVGDGKEDRAEFDGLHQKLRDYYRPDGIQDELDIEELAVGYWRKARAARAEVGAIRGSLDTLHQKEARFRNVSLGTEKMFADTLPMSADNLLSSSAGIDYLLSLLEQGQVSRVSEVYRQLGLQPAASKNGIQQQITTLKAALEDRRSEVAQAEALNLSAKASELALPSLENIDKLIRYTTANDRQMDKIRDRLEKRRTERTGSAKSDIG